MGKGKGSKKSATSEPEPQPEKPSPAKKSTPKSVVATCKKCHGITSDAYPVHSKTDAMALCWHKDGCPGGHDDRTFDFS